MEESFNIITLKGKLNQWHQTIKTTVKEVIPKESNQYYAKLNKSSRDANLAPTQEPTKDDEYTSFRQKKVLPTSDAKMIICKREKQIRKKTGKKH